MNSLALLETEDVGREPEVGHGGVPRAGYRAEWREIKVVDKTTGRVEDDESEEAEEKLTGRGIRDPVGWSAVGGRSSRCGDGGDGGHGGSGLYGDAMYDRGEGWLPGLGATRKGGTGGGEGEERNERFHNQRGSPFMRHEMRANTGQIKSRQRASLSLSEENWSSDVIFAHWLLQVRPDAPLTPLCP
jgi:hypothetical protein